MALQKSGVQLVAENESGFVGSMGRAQKSVQSFEGSVTRSAGGFGIAQAAAAGFAGFLGGAVLGAISGAINGFANLGKSAFGVVAGYERLSMSLAALTAKEVLNAGAASTMGEAMEKAAPLARELLNWVEELAIKSPFDQEGVATALRTAVAYGFVTTAASSVAEAQEKGIVTAQRLTQALIDWASGAGFTSFAMERVSLALGQMQAKGKVSGQELRQLTEAGLGTNAILTEMGYTLQDVENGLVSADEFILQFAKTMEADFGGAAERSAGTLAGLANSISDLGKKYLREFFGPINESTGKIGGILGVVQPILQRFVDTLMDERVLNAVHMLGTFLGDVLTGGISKAGQAMSGFMQTIGQPIIDTANAAFNWGQNIVTQLANGIIQAASSVLIGAINFIAGILSNWFAPGSPPKIAPQIDLWGKEAINQWLHGFTEADYGILKGIQSPLQSALNVLVQAGSIDKDAAGQAFAGISQDLIEAIASGTGLEDVLARITEEAGQFGPELADLALKQFALAAGVKAVEQAEQDLAAARKAEEQAGLKVNKLTQEYNDLLRSGATGDVLKDKLAEINLAQDEQDAAKAAATEAETRLDAAKETLEILEQQVKLQKELLDQLIAIAQAQIPTPVTEPPEPAGGGGTPPGGGLPTFDPVDIEEKFNEMLDNIIQSIKDKFADAFQPVIDAWNKALLAIQAAWDNFLAALTASGLIEQFLSIWDNLQALALIGLSILWEFIDGGLQTIASLWEKHREQVERIWNKFWNLLSSIAGGVLGLIVSNIDQRLEEARSFFEERRQQISNIIELFWNNTEKAFDVGLTVILGFTEDRLNSMQALWDTRGIQILASVNRLWDNISLRFFEVLGLLTDFVETKLEVIQGWWEQHGTNVELVVDRFMDTIGNILDIVMLYISTTILFWVNYFADLWEQHGESIKILVQSFLDAIGAIFDTVLGLIGASFDTWAALIKGDWEGFLQGISDFWGSIWDGILAYVEASFTSIKTAVGVFIASVIRFFENLYHALIGGSIIPDMLDAMSTYFQNTFDYIYSVIYLWINTVKTNIELLKLWWGTTWDDIRQKITDVWDGIITKVKERVQTVHDDVTGKITEILTWIGTKISDFKAMGGDLINGLKDGVLGAVADLVQAVVDAIQAAIDAAMGLLDEGSPSKLFMEIGQNVSLGFAEGILNEQRAPVSAITDTINAMVSPLAASSPSYVNNTSNTINNNFSNNVGGNMDVRQLENLIVKTVRRALVT